MSYSHPGVCRSRRRFLQAVGAGSGLLAMPALLIGGRARGSGASDLFSLGVASGDPSDRSVVLWTRLAPDPLNGGGMPAQPVAVRWFVATDAAMTNVIRSGQVTASPQDGHAVHVLATDLPANRWLWYRFEALGAVSRIGRTRTFPGPRERTERLRFAIANCQHYEQGFYPAYADMLGQGLDCIIHVGDYIYEGDPTASPIAPGRVHNSPEVVSVVDYRNRYALYRLDPDLQAAHAMYPFIVTPDDHEVENNYAGLIPEESSPIRGAEFAARRRAAYQVYSEYMPLPPRHRQVGRRNAINLARRLHFGDLADLHILDTRQFRSDQPAGDGFGSVDPMSRFLEGVLEDRLFDAEGILNPQATLLGTDQEAWLARSLATSRAHWNVLAQQVMVTPWNLIGAARANIAANPNIPPAQKEALLAVANAVSSLVNVDAWDGYQAARNRLLGMLAQLRPNNPVILTGDIHSAWAAELLSDFTNPGGADLLAVEFVSTAISSTFLALDPRPADFLVRQSIPDNPHIRFFNGLFRGYCLCDLDRERWQTTYRAVGTLAALQDPNPLALVPRPTTPVADDAVFTIQAGFNRPGSAERLQGTSRLPPTGPLT